MSWITVCGGGNGAHALIGTLLLRDKRIQIRLYLPIEGNGVNSRRQLAVNHRLNYE